MGNYSTMSTEHYWVFFAGFQQKTYCISQTVCELKELRKILRDCPFNLPPPTSYTPIFTSKHLLCLLSLRPSHSLSTINSYFNTNIHFFSFSAFLNSTYMLMTVPNVLLSSPMYTYHHSIGSQSMFLITFRISISKGVGIPIDHMYAPYIGCSAAQW